MRLALLTEIPAPFRIALFNELAARADVDLRLLFLSENDPRRGYPLYADELRFDWRVLPGRGVVRGGRWLVLNAGVGAALRAFRPDAVAVGGWNQPAFWQALGYARLRRLPFLVWVESTLRDVRSESGAIDRARRTMIRLSSGCFVPGNAAAEYARSLGMPADRVAIAPNAADLDVFGAGVAEAARRRGAIRDELDLDGPVVLCVSRLSPEKGVDVLVRAAADVPATVVVVGDGPLADGLRRLAPPNVRFAGRVERDGLPRWLAAADVFCLPSRSDTWGMVLSEAAVAGLPLVSTEAPGAAYDLIEPGANGERVPVDDPPALAAALRRAVEAGEEWRRAAGARSRELVSTATPAAWAAAVAGLATRASRRP